MHAQPALRPSRTLHGTYTERVARPPASVDRPLGVWVAQAAWLGLASGLMEAGVVFGHRTVVGTVTSESVRLNRYHVPLGILASLAVFAVAAGAALLLSGRWSRRFWRDPFVSTLGWFVALLSPIMALEELHTASILLLAIGLAACIGRRWVAHREWILRRTLAPLFVGSTLLAAGNVAWIRTSEARARAALPPAPLASPNVVLVVLDTVRADHLSFYGYGRPTTPTLDALAPRAVHFDFARSAAPWTLPAHAAMFTGRWPHELSVDYDRPLDGTHPTLAGFLAGRGYDTGGFVGNTVYCNSWFGVDRGFARYEDAYENWALSFNEALRSLTLTRELMPLAVDLGLLATDGRFSPRKTAAQVNRDALAWLDGRPERDRPFFLFLNYIDAHGPYTVPDDFPRRFSTASRVDLIRANRRANNKQLPDAERYAALDRLGVDAYDDAIRYVDAQIGRLLAELERRGQRRDTWVVVTADHGEHFGEHGLYIHGNSLYRPLVDVPLLVIPPDDGTPGRRVEAPVSLRNLPATVADLVGLADSSPFPGQSLRPHWDDSAPPPGRSAVLSEWKVPHGTAGLDDLPPDDRVRAALVRDDRIYHRDPLGPEALFHAEDDAEDANLIDRPGERPLVDRFRARHEKFRAGDR